MSQARNKKYAYINSIVKPATKVRLCKYADKHHIPYGRVVRACLEAVPFDDDSVTPVVLKIPKSVLCSPESLREWLASAGTEVEAYFYPPVKPPDDPKPVDPPLAPDAS